MFVLDEKSSDFLQKLVLGEISSKTMSFVDMLIIGKALFFKETKETKNRCMRSRENSSIIPKSITSVDDVVITRKHT